jgi:sugar phosphate isomerase/epimerase
MLASCVAALPAVSGLRALAAPPPRERLGIVSYSLHLRLAADRKNKTGLTDPLAFAEYCHHLGAGGMQLPLGVAEPAVLRRLHDRLQQWGMYLEGSLRLPANEADVERFTAEVQAAKAAGARILRTVLLDGRRYETFDSAAAFRALAQRAWKSLRWAEPIVARSGMILAVENHKDHRAAELVALLERLGSAHVGACVDTGNNLALLEEPLETVRALAPWARSVHLKDMAVAEHRDGFLLWETPLGEGILELDRIVTLLRQARPEIHLSLEMITRDPLIVPCLTPRYWATSEGVPARQLARLLTLVRNRASRSIPQISRLSPAQQLAREEDNVRKCLQYAQQHLES